MATNFAGNVNGLGTAGGGTSSSLWTYTAKGANTLTSNQITAALGTGWTDNALGYSWSKVLWIADWGVYYMVNQNSTGSGAAWSTTGVGGTWNVVTGMPAQPNNGIAYSPVLKLAVICRNDGFFMSSANGISWNVHAIANPNVWNAVVWGNDRFMAVAANGTRRLGYSTDGTNWYGILDATIDSYQWFNIEYANGVFIASGNNALARSTDNGATWTVTALGGSWYGIAYGGSGRWVATGNTVNNAYSTDNGATWNTNVFSWSVNYRALTYASELGRFIVAGDNTSTAYHSTNGITWTSFTLPAGRFNSSITWSPTQGRLVISCTNYFETSAQILATPAADSLTYVKSTTTPPSTPDITTAFNSWTIRYTGGLGSGLGWYKMLAGAGKFVAANYQGQIMYSSDGATWTQALSGGPIFFRGLAWSDTLNLFVALPGSSSTAFYTSTDGVTWTGRTLSVSHGYFYAIWCGAPLNKFFAVSSDGGNLVGSISSDGITWTDINSTVRGGIANFSPFSVAYSPSLNMLVVGGGNYIYDNIIVSTDGGSTWTKKTLPVEMSINSIAWSSKLSLFVLTTYTTGGLSRFYTTTDMTTFTAGPITSGICYGLRWVSDLECFIACPYGYAQFYYSFNGTTWTTVNTSYSYAWYDLDYSSTIGMVAMVSLNNGTTQQVYTSGVVKPTITYGNVGIGLANPAYQLDLSQDGARKLTTTTWLTGSDKNLKEDIQIADYSRCAKIIGNLDLKHFKWREDIYAYRDVKDRHMLGWIAQDVATYFPNSVQMSRVADSPTTQINALSLDPDQLFKTMYGAVRYLMQEVEALKLSANEVSEVSVANDTSQVASE